MRLLFLVLLLSVALMGCVQYGQNDVKPSPSATGKPTATPLTCVQENESLGPVIPGNDAQCCPGLEPYIPEGMVGTFGTCMKPGNMPTDTTDGAGLANPAAKYCVEAGFKSKIIDTPQGQSGVCVFPDGGHCEEWAFFRGECGLADLKSNCCSQCLYAASKDPRAFDISDELCSSYPADKKKYDENGEPTDINVFTPQCLEYFKTNPLTVSQCGS